LPLSWFQLWTICWQVAMFVTPIFMAAFALWMRSQFVTKTDATAERNRIDGAMAASKTLGDTRYESLKDKSADHEGRIKTLEKSGEEPPTRHSLNNEITKLIGVVGRLESAVSGLASQAQTTQTYLHTLVERGLDR
jgi:hypothetical protein